MRAPFEWFVAMRYLRGAQNRSGGTRFFRFIVYAGIGGIAVGVIALLLALMIVRGFSREIEDKIVGFGAHVQVEHFLNDPISNADTLYTALTGFEGVQAVDPVVNGFILLRASSEIEGILLHGVNEGTLPFLQDRVVEGTFSFEPDDDRVGIVLGETLARLLGLSVGDRILGLAMRTDQVRSASISPRVTGFVVRGIFDTGLADFDGTFAYTDLDTSRRLLGYAEDQVSRFDLRLAGLDEAIPMAGRINMEHDLPITARPIQYVQANLFAWVRLQQSIIPLVIGVIILVAAFNVIGLLLMLILEKTREIGVLRSMGAGAAGVRRLFVFLGFLMGSIGTIMGLSLALVLGVLQDRFSIIPLPQEAYYIDTAPIELYAPDFVVVAVIAIVLCTLAAYVPARVAASIEPIRAIRFAG